MGRLQGPDRGGVGGGWTEGCFQGKSEAASTLDEISNCCNFLISFQGKESGKGKYGPAIFIFNFLSSTEIELIYQSIVHI